MASSKIHKFGNSPNRDVFTVGLIEISKDKKMMILRKCDPTMVHESKLLGELQTAILNLSSIFKEILHKGTR